MVYYQSSETLSLSHLVSFLSINFLISSPVQPRMGYMNPLVTVIEGEDVELNCQAVIGNPRPKVLLS